MFNEIIGQPLDKHGVNISKYSYEVKQREKCEVKKAGRKLIIRAPLQPVYMWKSVAGKIHKMKILVASEGQSPDYGPCGYVIFITKIMKGEVIELRSATTADANNFGGGVSINIVSHRFLHVSPPPPFSLEVYQN